jgi:hypothetical protein
MSTTIRRSPRLASKVKVEAKIQKKSTESPLTQPRRSARLAEKKAKSSNEQKEPLPFWDKAFDCYDDFEGYNPLMDDEYMSFQEYTMQEALDAFEYESERMYRFLCDW